MRGEVGVGRWRWRERDYRDEGLGMSASGGVFLVWIANSTEMRV